MMEAPVEELSRHCAEASRERSSRDILKSALENLRAGRMAIVLTGEDEDPIGHLVLGARQTTPEAVNFMAIHGRGVICLVIRGADLVRLQLPMQQRSFGPSGREAPVSIEARDGVSTGISATDRARTVQVAADPASGPEDIVSPGHIFPLLASEGGVFKLAGPAEAAVDLCRLAGLDGPATLCAVLDEGGGKAREGWLSDFGRRFGIPVVSSRALLDYRCRFDRQIERMSEEFVELQAGGALHAALYRSLTDGREVLALVREQGGDEQAGPAVVRVQRGISLREHLGFPGAPEHTRQALRELGAASRGALLMLESAPGMLSRSLAAGEEDEPMTFADGVLIARVLKELRFEEVSPPHNAASLLARCGLRVLSAAGAER